MSTHPHVDHSQGDPRFAGRVGSVKAEPTACLERPPADTSPSLGSWQTEIPPPAQKTFDAEGEILEHALTKSLRIRNEAIKRPCSSVRRFRDATIKEECKSGFVEGVGPGRGPDSELIRCADDTDEPLQKKNLLAGTTSRYRHNGTCRSVGISLRHRSGKSSRLRIHTEFSPCKMIHSKIYLLDCRTGCPTVPC
jgi:hypothetical protein